MSEGFLKRWSRRKTEIESSEVKPLEDSAQQSDIAKPSQNVNESAYGDQKPPVTMDDVEKIDTFAPDFSAFMKPGVDPAIQQAALKKMFTDPHFNVMDRLDIYIDDYSQPDPLPTETLKRMVQSDMLELFRKDEVSKPAEIEESIHAKQALLSDSESDSSIADSTIKTIHEEE